MNSGNVSFDFLEIGTRIYIFFTPNDVPSGDPEETFANGQKYFPTDTSCNIPCAEPKYLNLHFSLGLKAKT